MEKDETQSLSLTEMVRVNGSPAEASLAADGELRWRGEDGVRCLALEPEVLGIEVEGRRLTVKAFQVDTKGVSCGGGGGGGKSVRKDYVFEMSTEDSAIRWSERLKDCINFLDRPKRLFIIVNPFGGKRCARKIFETEIKPLLEAAGVLFTVQETEYQLHAQEIAYSMDVIKYDGIVCISGDGILVEVVNGLLRRGDWVTAIKVPLGIIPAGTGNGMAKSLLDSIDSIYSVSNAAFSILRGHRRPLDVASVVQGETKFFSVLMLTWGLVADIDIESERYRWMGSIRLDFYSLLRIMNLRKYSGHVQFVPAPGYEEYGEAIKQVDSPNGKTAFSEEGRGNNIKAQSHAYQGPLIEFEGSAWRSLDGPFISVWINNVPWVSEDAKLAPEAKFSDGYLDAVIIRECPKLALLSLMLKMSDGSYVKSPYVTYLKVKAFRLEPGQRVGSTNKGGIIDSDGEVIARGDGCHGGNQQGNLMAYGPPIQMTVDQGLATIFSPR
ncbi:sphingosine kinase 2-like isoform X2 [Typha latifolia]|uniref:sphingosine kinase 2-like isoform X2 n=1 Tax=Typha latifolia TaxID=4733 RepID=UPI003C2F2B48